VEQSSTPPCRAGSITCATPNTAATRKQGHGPAGRWKEDALTREVGRTHTRKPLLSLRLSGSFLLRLAARALSSLLFYEPPRTTRSLPGRPTDLECDDSHRKPAPT